MKPIDDSTHNNGDRGDRRKIFGVTALVLVVGCGVVVVSRNDDDTPSDIVDESSTGLRRSTTRLLFELDISEAMIAAGLLTASPTTAMPSISPAPSISGMPSISSVPSTSIMPSFSPAPSGTSTTWLDVFSKLSIPEPPTSSPSSQLDVLGNMITTWRKTTAPTIAPTPDPTSDNVDDDNVDDDNVDDDNDDDNNKPTGSFRLKMYWQDSYNWQDFTEDPKYCMECSGSCREGQEIRIMRCGGDKFVVVGNTIRPASDTSLCFTVMGYSTAKDTDGDPITEPIQLKDCNGDSDQEFDGFQSNGGFELRPQNRGDRCLGTNHHPKSSEKVHPKSCSQGRGDTTSEWEPY
jgi:hypothetical protein